MHVAREPTSAGGGKESLSHFRHAAPRQSWLAAKEHVQSKERRQGTQSGSILIVRISLDWTAMHKPSSSHRRSCVKAQSPAAAQEHRITILGMLTKQLRSELRFVTHYRAFPESLFCLVAWNTCAL